MAKVMLAEWHGGVWLVAGEAHLDDLLFNALPPGVGVELIDCESHAAVMALWRQNCDPSPTAAGPFQINPAIAARVRGAAQSDCVVFSPWSALIDEAGMAVLRRVADVIVKAPSTVLVIKSVVVTNASSVVELSRLRLMVVQDELRLLGVESYHIAAQSYDSTGSHDNKNHDGIIQLTYDTSSPLS